MDEWTPEPEQRVDAEWLAQEHDRLARQEATWRESQVEDENETIVNGSVRSTDGRFRHLPDRVFRTDGADTLPPDEYEETLLRIRHETIRTGVLSPGPALELAATMRRLSDELEYEAVAFARGYGWSWRDIGDALRMTESGAHRRFARDLQRRARRGRR